MPVTHGVRGSSPLRTAEDDFYESSFFCAYGTRSVGGGVAEVSALGVYKIVIVATQRR